MKHGKKHTSNTHADNTETIAEQVQHEEVQNTQPEVKTVLEGTETVAHETASTVEQPEKKVRDIRISKKSIAAVVIFIALVAFIYHERALLVAATVNGSPISRLSVIHKLESTGGKQALDAMITQKLIQEEAKKKGIVVTDEEINAEIKKINDLVSAQGGTLDLALSQRGLTMDDLKKQITIQKEVEKMLGDQVAVTDTEVDQYIAQNKFQIPKEQMAEARAKIKEDLKTQKTDQMGQTFVNSLQSSAKIVHFVGY